MPYNKKTAQLMPYRGLKFIGRNKAVIDVRKHSDIMEDAIDRIRIKEAKAGDLVPWEQAKKIIESKRVSNGNVYRKIGKKSNKVPGNDPAKRLR